MLFKSYPEEMFDEEDVEDVEFEYIRENVLDYAKVRWRRR